MNPHSTPASTAREPWLDNLMRLIHHRAELRSRDLLFGIFDPKPPENFIDQLGRSILDELTIETAASRLYVESASLTIAARLLQKHCDSGTCASIESAAHRLDHIRLRRVLGYIEANVKDDITLADLAGIAGYSAFNFARKFTLAMGVSPHRYISRIRLENAMAELAAGKLPLAEVALNAHFSSQASFTRAFHRAAGMTPREYRRRRL